MRRRDKHWPKTIKGGRIIHEGKQLNAGLDTDFPTRVPEAK